MGRDRTPVLGLQRVVALVGSLLLAACASHGGRYYQSDGPPDKIPAGLAAVPDAVPRIEALNAHANQPYTALGQRYAPDISDAPFEQQGIASWYGRQYHGKRTTSGEPYDMFAMTAAHPTLPIPSYAQVTNLRDGRSAIVRINDRGPFLQGRVIDLSYAAATRLGIAAPGSGLVHVHKITARDIAAGFPQPAVVAATPVAPVVSTPPAAAPAAKPVAEPVTEPVARAMPVSPPAPTTVSALPAMTAPAASAAPAAGAAPMALAPAPVATTAPTAVAAPETAAAATAMASGPATSGTETASRGECTSADATRGPGWAIQLGVFAQVDHASAFCQHLAARLATTQTTGRAPQEQHPRVEFDGRLYRILLGRYTQRDLARDRSRELRELLTQDTALYAYP